MRFVFFTVVFSVLFLLCGYTTWRGVQSLAVFGAYKYIFAAVAGTLFISLMLGFLWGESLPAAWAKPISFLGYSYVVLAVYLLIAFLMIDIVLLLNSLLHFITNIPLFKLISFSIVLTGIVVAMCIGNYKFNHPETVYLNLESNKTKQDKSLRIVAVSDLHLGFSNQKEYAEKYVKLINEQMPDLVVIAGDLIDRSIKPLLQQNMQENLMMIQSKYGVYAIPGNHEYFGENMEQVYQFLQSCNIHMLRDASVLIEDDFYVVGRDDKSNPNRASLFELTTSLTPNKPIILLDHQPYHLEDAASQKIDFQFSGHTHNGQFYPINRIVKKMYENPYGYLKKDTTHIYVSSGLGIWGPQYRIGTQSELVVIEFKY